jgi:hypothetical protein
MAGKTRDRSGTAVVELAVCIPVIFVIVFASIEACNMIALKQILSEASYDGALLALRPDADEAEILAGINTMLAARNVTPSNILIQGEGGSAFDSIGHGDMLTVRIEAETAGNVIGPQLFGMARTLSGASTAIKQ